MEKVDSQLLYIALVSFVIFLFTTTVLGQEVDDEKDFNYVKGSERGPENWGLIKEEWATCNTGKLQSPIDLIQTRVEKIPRSARIYRFYRRGNAVIKNKGHDIEVNWKDQNSKIRINGVDYILQNSHWHSPSEHTINGKRYDLEMHMVHQSQDNKVAVIGLLFEIGKPDRFIREITNSLKLLSNTTLEVDAGRLNPWDIEMHGWRYYRYMGSFTTPPCTEGVIWTVNAKIETVSKDQIALLRKAVRDDSKNNARPLQPINGRPVQLYSSFLH